MRTLMVIPKKVAKNHNFTIYTKNKLHSIEMSYDILKYDDHMVIKMIGLDGLQFRVILKISNKDDIKINPFTDKTLIHQSESHLLKIWGLEISGKYHVKITSDMVTESNCSLRFYSCTQNIYKFKEVLGEYHEL